LSDTHLPIRVLERFCWPPHRRSHCGKWRNKRVKARSFVWFPACFKGWRIGSQITNRRRIMNANGKSQSPAASIGQARQLRRRPVAVVPENVLTDTAALFVPQLENRPSNQFPPCSSTSSSCSCCGDNGGHVCKKACPSTFACAGCAEVLHELANVMTAVLTNTQVLSWKLPPYSHLKRSVREVERNAQRSSELLKRLVNRCAEKASGRELQP
jgi:hypothetical protein